MKVLLELNIVLDVLLNREPFVADSAGVLRANHEGRIEGHVSAISLPTLFYIVRRNSDLEKAHHAIRECLDSFTISPVDRAVLEMAAGLPGSDFEDNVQIACAVESKLEAIVTRDPHGFKQRLVSVLTPADLLARLANPTEEPS